MQEINFSEFDNEDVYRSVVHQSTFQDESRVILIIFNHHNNTFTYPTYWKKEQKISDLLMSTYEHLHDLFHKNKSMNKKSLGLTIDNEISGYIGPYKTEPKYHINDIYYSIVEKNFKITKLMPFFTINNHSNMYYELHS